MRVFFRRKGLTTLTWFVTRSPVVSISFVAFLGLSLLLYLKSYILPSYCDIVWSGCTKDEAYCLETVLNFTCHTVLCRRRDYSAARELGLSTLSARKNSTRPKPCQNACLPSLLLIFFNFSLPQPLTITLVHLLLANLIYLLQKLALGKRLSV